MLRAVTLQSSRTKKKKKIKMSKKRIYISLPISGYDLDERKETALAMEVKLRGRGYDVFNPLGDNFQPGLTTNEYMKLDLKALLDCDAIMFMHNFNKSAGCHTELCVAMACGMEIWFEDLQSPQKI
nr:MAG TPA: protein of unknown function (DUF4406) [Caudoviricetes sp.]